MAFREDSFYIERIKDGDSDAFTPLVEKHKDLVYTIVVKILRSREDAEEIAQDVFIKAYKSLDSFEGKSKFSTWLYRIAYNTAISKTRKKSLKTADLEDEVIQNFSDDEFREDLYEISSEEQVNILNRALKDLDENENLLISLFYKEDKSIEDISAITGLSDSNVKVRLHRTRKKLFQMMNQLMKAGKPNKFDTK